MDAERMEWRRPRPEAAAVLAAMSGTLAVTAALLVADSRCLHWFLVPLLGCGLLAGMDAAEWLGGGTGLFDPAGLFGLYGVHFFFLAPLLHVCWDVWRPWVPGPGDWRTWLGWMAALNFAGLLAFRCARLLAERLTPAEPPSVTWRLNRRAFGRLLAVTLTAAALLQGWVYARLGGITGYIQAVSEAARDFGRENAFTGLGPVFMISESFPFLAWMGILAWFRDRRILRSWTGAALGMAAIFILLLLFGGLRGSRAATVWSMFLIAGSYHLWVRPIPKRILAAGLVFVGAFMYLYGFYKAHGLEAIRALQDSSNLRRLEQDTGRSAGTLILGDLARSDAQALILYRVAAPGQDFEPAWGRTYLGALSILIPRFLWPVRPDGKVRWTTEIEMGREAYRSGRWVSSMVAGMAGEAMLNFSLWAVPAVYGLFGLLVGWTRRLVQRMDAHDSRRLLLPLLIILAILVPVSDMDNVVFFLMKHGALPALVIVLSSARVASPRPQEAH